MLIKRKCVCYWLFLVLFSLPAFFCFEVPAAYGEYKIEASTDKPSVMEGESLTLTVTVASDASIAVQPKEPDFKDFQVDARRQFNKVSIINGVQRIEAGYNYSLRPLKTGKLTIGRFELSYADASGVQRTVQTEPIEVEVNAEKNEEEPAPAPVAAKKEDPAERNVISNHLIVITAVIVCAFILIWFVIWQSSRREKTMASSSKNDESKLRITQYSDGSDMAGAGKNSQAVSADSDGRSCRAKEKLDFNAAFQNIVSMKKAGDYKNMFVQIPKIIKQGVQADGGCGLCELTNQEFIGRAEKLPGLSSRITEISDILSLCDMVNYARHTPSDAEVETVIKNLSNISRLFERGGN